MVYFIQSVDGGNIKIGTTKNLTSRLSSLTSEYKTKFAVLAVIPGSFAEESATHKRFLSARTFGRDWFKPVPEILEFIETHGRPWDGKNETPKLKMVWLPDEVAKHLRGAAACRNMDLNDFAESVLWPFLKNDITESLGEDICRQEAG